jgi:pilus assembly protein CpaF
MSAPSTPLWAHLHQSLSPALRRNLGVLADYVDDPRVTDIFVRGTGSVFVDTGEGAHHVTGLVLTPSEATDLARRLIELGGRHLDEAQPLADANLGQGIRVHAAIPPIARLGAEISLRIHRQAKASLDALALRDGARLIPQLIALVQSRASLLITGSTGSGKTTLVGALMAYAGSQERLVVLEDLAELSIDHPHVVSLECRMANLEGAGEITLARLVRESLRMKPDRLIVGECRGAELANLLQAFLTGHRGGATTIHAGGIEEIPARLDALGALAGLSERQLTTQAITAFDRVIHLERGDDQQRHLIQGHLVLGPDGTLDVRVDS